MSGEFYKITDIRNRVYTDRYKTCKLLEDAETGDVLLSTREINDIPITPSDIYHRIASNELNRLDLLAHNYYHNPLLWWVIAQANDIYDPFAPIEIGTMIRIPAIETLYGHNGILL